LFVGAGVGATVGGIGGRVAMRVLAVTSDDSPRGALTDDEEQVGEITLDGTFGLVIFIAIFVGEGLAGVRPSASDTGASR
jgi:hypothetical protein